MRHYIETNALYSIKKIPNRKIRESFTSSLAIFELISGINKTNFNKRKNILNNIQSSSIQIVWAMPEELMYKSFNILKEYDFIEERIPRLKSLLYKINKHDSFDSFCASSEYTDFKYFKDMDITVNNDFSKATWEGNIDIYNSVDTSQNPSINKSIYIDEMVNQLPHLNKSISVFAIAINIQKSLPDISIESIYTSYNGYIDVFINGFTSFTHNKILKFENAKNNDLIDLYHLLYLTNNNNYSLVSNDKIYIDIIPNNLIKLEQFV
jgi:hypothetical protein